MDDRIFVPSPRPVFIPVRSIQCILAADDDSEMVQSDTQRFLVSSTLKEWESRLPSSVFVRIHRSCMINLDAVNRIEKHSTDSLSVFLKNVSAPQTVSRRYAARIKHRLR